LNCNCPPVSNDVNQCNVGVIIQ